MKKVIKKVISGFIYAIEGVKFLLKDPSWQIEFVVFLLALPFLYFIDVALVEKLLMFFSIMLVLICEAINTGIESAIDRISTDIHPLAKKAKDVASAAVFLAIINAAIIWILIIF